MKQKQLLHFHRGAPHQHLAQQDQNNMEAKMSNVCNRSLYRMSFKHSHLSLMCFVIFDKQEYVICPSLIVIKT